MKTAFLMSCVLLACYCSARPIDIDACIVGDPNSVGGAFNETVISNSLVEVNRIFRQAAMSFRLRSCMYTNDAFLAEINSTNIDQVVSLCSILEPRGGLNVFFVPEVSNGELGFENGFGIVVKQLSGAGVFAHEIGHACGLADIYDWHEGTTLVVQGASRKEWMPHDWGRSRNGNNHAAMIRRLLMYGYHADESIDISYGDVYGLWYTKEVSSSSNQSTNAWHLSLAPVGFHFHGNRHPQSE